MISPFVINFESKHPDYIYIKYHIYKEMQQRKNAELQSKVKTLLLFDRRRKEKKEKEDKFIIYLGAIAAISEMDQCDCASDWKLVENS